MQSRLVLVVLLAPLAGCNAGLISMARHGTGDDGGRVGDGGLSDAAPLAARDIFERSARPLFELRCASCHGDGGTASAPDFLASRPSVYENLKGWPALVDTARPADSRVITKGRHDGPAWTTTEATTIRAWLDAEAAEADPVEAAPCTALAVVDEGANSYDLGVLGLRGSALSFAASRVSPTAMYLSDLRVIAGPGGLHAVHPVFVAWVAGVPRAPTIDELAGVELSVAAGVSEPLLGAGGLSLVDFPTGSQLSICFDSIDSLSDGTPAGDGGLPAGGDGGVAPIPPPAGGCAEVAAFTMFAQPQLTRYCTSCHGGTRATATAALDLTSAATMTPTAQRTACNQVLGRVNRTSLMSSAIFVQPDPEGTATSHDFHFRTAAERDAFKAQILLWVTMEP